MSISPEDIRSEDTPYGNGFRLGREHVEVEVFESPLVLSLEFTLGAIYSGDSVQFGIGYEEGVEYERDIERPWRP